MQLLLIALNVIFGLTSVQLDNAMGTDQGVKENFRSFFDSIKKNDMKKTDSYRSFLEQEATREQQAFEMMKEELKFIRQRNPYHKRDNIGEKIALFKREEAKGEDLKTRLDGALTSLTAKINGLRAGRATTSLLEPVKVDVYGSKMSINQLGTISVPEPRLIAIQVWDKTQIPDIEKAILNANLGLNPSNDGSVIRIPVPALTEERRRDLTKKAAEYGEGGKVAVRNLRREAQNELKKRAKNKELSEDELALEMDKVKEMVDSYLRQVEDIVERKSKEILAA